jgi:hypothetical protein
MAILTAYMEVQAFNKDHIFTVIESVGHGGYAQQNFYNIRPSSLQSCSRTSILQSEWFGLLQLLVVCGTLAPTLEAMCLTQLTSEPR